MLIGIRSLFTIYVNFHSHIFRLEDRPSRIYLITIVVNVLSFLALLGGPSLSGSELLVLFFVPSGIVIIVHCARFLALRVREIEVGAALRFLKSALSFSWPVMLNVLAMSFVNNYAKIFAFNRLGEEVTAGIAFILRVALVIQLSHAAFLAYYSKSLYMNEKKTLHFNNLLRYNLVVGCTAAAAVLFVMVAPQFIRMVDLSSPLVAILLIIYTVVWCYIAYLELYFGIMNANRRVLVYSVISAVVYIGLMLATPHLTIQKMAWYMVASVTLNLAMVLAGLRTLGVIGNAKA